MNIKQYFDRTVAAISAVEVVALTLLWLLLFIEPLQYGAVKISQTWKVVLIILLLASAWKKTKPVWLYIAFAFAFKFLVYSYYPYGVMQNLQDALESLILPLLIYYWYNRYKNNQHYQAKLLHLAVLLSLFVLYSSVPSLLGLPSLNPETNLSKYGIEANATKGLFYHIAVASQVYTYATLVLLCAHDLFKKNKVIYGFYLITLVYGVYLVYGSFARTGWFIFIVGVFLFYFLGTGKYKYTKTLIFGVMFGMGIYFLYQTSEAVQLRLKGGATYRQNVELSAESLAKSRLPFIYVAIDNMKQEGVASTIIGYGKKKGMDYFEEKIGLSIVSHNGTFEIIETSGLIGLFLFMLFNYAVYRKMSFNFPIWSNGSRRLLLITLFVYVGLFVTSHGMPLWGHLIMAPIIAASLIAKRNKKLNTIQAKSIESRGTKLIVRNGHEYRGL